MKFLFKHFSSDKRVYNLCQGYFTRALKEKLNIPIEANNNLIPNQYDYCEKIYDANPIFCYCNNEIRKIVCIILIPASEYNEDLSGNPRYDITAWIDKFTYKGTEYNELVISSFMSEQTSRSMMSFRSMMSLMSKWLKNDVSEGFERVIEDVLGS